MQRDLCPLQHSLQVQQSKSNYLARQGLLVTTHYIESNVHAGKTPAIYIVHRIYWYNVYVITCTVTSCHNVVTTYVVGELDIQAVN